MSDISDDASVLEQRLRDAALAAQAAKRRTGESAEDCVDCGERIPEARRRAVVTDRCCNCASQL